MVSQFQSTFRLKPLAEYLVKYIAFKIRNRTRTLRSSAPAENQLAMAEFSPVKSPVFGMELVPFSCSKTALRSRLIAERNTFESGFKECGQEYVLFKLQILNLYLLVILVPHQTTSKPTCSYIETLNPFPELLETLENLLFSIRTLKCPHCGRLFPLYSGLLTHFQVNLDNSQESISFFVFIDLSPS